MDKQRQQLEKYIETAEGTAKDLLQKALDKVKVDIMVVDTNLGTLIRLNMMDGKWRKKAAGVGKSYREIQKFLEEVGDEKDSGL